MVVQSQRLCPLAVPFRVSARERKSRDPRLMPGSARAPLPFAAPQSMDGVTNFRSVALDLAESEGFDLAMPLSASYDTPPCPAVADLVSDRTTEDSELKLNRVSSGSGTSSLNASCTPLVAANVDDFTSALWF